MKNFQLFFFFEKPDLKPSLATMSVTSDYDQIIEDILYDDYTSSRYQSIIISHHDSSSEEYTMIFNDLAKSVKKKKKSKLRQTNVILYEKGAKISKGGLDSVGEGVIYVKQKLGFSKRCDFFFNFFLDGFGLIVWWAQVDSSAMYLFKSEKSVFIFETVLIVSLRMEISQKRLLMFCFLLSRNLILCLIY